ncbi:hypothetical protein NEF87_005079 [Candidatus Lokiarchaeum ossiferum]|uniref:Uncharacterized protein n=1 Tax=Candidatus Lokiarchaeum ossiferum TaxID=2951803 RepID=A0ABY6I293_9ARCH|nr:hypothetical protein NEF87_005079 [Candidatus Lokiarchaeum sp. B-35]
MKLSSKSFRIPKKWSFRDLEEEVVKPQQIYAEFFNKFRSSESDDIGAYIENLDENFTEWNANFTHHLGKKN